MARCTCGATIVAATAPSGRLLRLHPSPVFVQPGEEWPAAIYEVTQSGRRLRATPAIESILRVVDGENGPYYLEHRHP